jgi:hypothetical protein
MAFAAVGLVVYSASRVEASVKSELSNDVAGQVGLTSKLDW